MFLSATLEIPAACLQIIRYRLNDRTRGVSDNITNGSVLVIGEGRFR